MTLGHYIVSCYLFMSLKIIIYMMPISVAFFERSRSDWSSLTTKLLVEL